MGCCGSQPADAKAARQPPQKAPPAKPAAPASPAEAPAKEEKQAPTAPAAPAPAATGPRASNGDVHVRGIRRASGVPEPLDAKIGSGNGSFTVTPNRPRGASRRRNSTLKEPQQFRKGDILLKLPPVTDVVAKNGKKSLEEQLAALDLERELQHERITALVQAIKEKQQEKQETTATTAATVKKTRLTREERQRVLEIFKKFDTDGSNEMDSIEFRGMCKELGVELTAAEATEHVLNMSSTGMVDFEGFLTWWSGEGAGKGAKSTAVSLAKSRLNRLTAREGGLKEQMALMSARSKAGVGVPIETDLKVNLGTMAVPRTQIKASLTNRTEDVLRDVKETRFEDVCNADDTANVYSIVELELADAPGDEIDVFVNTLKHLCECAETVMTANLCDQDDPSQSIKLRVVDKRPMVELKLAVANDAMERKWLEMFLGTDEPDEDDLDRLMSKLVMDISLGVNMKEYLRRLLEDAESWTSLGNEGVSVAVKGSIAPGAVTVLQKVLPSIAFGSAEDDLLTRKLQQLIAASIHHTHVDLSMGYPLQVLDSAVGSIVDRIGAAIPEERHTPALLEELNNFKFATVFTTTLFLEKTLTLSNTPLVDMIKSVRELDAQKLDETFGWNSAAYGQPAQFFFSAANLVQEVRNVALWTKYQSLTLDMSGFALFAGLPRSTQENQRFLNQRRVSRQLQANYARAQLLDFPLLTDELNYMDDSRHADLIDCIGSVMMAIEDIRDDDIEYACPG